MYCSMDESHTRYIRCVFKSAISLLDKGIFKKCYQWIEYKIYISGMIHYIGSWAVIRIGIVRITYLYVVWVKYRNRVLYTWNNTINILNVFSTNQYYVIYIRKAFLFWLYILTWILSWNLLNKLKENTTYVASEIIMFELRWSWDTRSALERKYGIS